MFCLVTLMLANAPDAVVARYNEVYAAPLTALGSTEEELASVEQVYLSELKALLGDRLRSFEELASESDLAAEAVRACRRSAECMMEALGAVGWDALLVGNLAGLGDDQVINLKLYDTRVGGELRRAQAALSGEESQLIRSMRELVVTVVAPEKLNGTLRFEASQPGVQIFLDGELFGTTPLSESSVVVPVGRHAVEGRGQGLVTYSNFVDVGYGEQATVQVQLATNTLQLGAGTPYTSRWWPWTIGGVGVLAAGVGGYFNLQQQDGAREIEARNAAGALDASALDLIEQERSDWRTARAFYATGATLVGTTLVLFALDLFAED